MAKARYGKGIKIFYVFVAYYSKFMKDVTTMTTPLQQLIVDVNTSSGKVISKRLSKQIKVVWNDKAIGHSIVLRLVYLVHRY